jgi:hypothetical protein
VKLLLILLALATALLPLPAHARRVGGVEIPETLESGGTSLVLNGAGIRNKYFIGVYVGGLYLKQRSADAAAIIDADEVMAVELRITSGLITSDRMKKSTEEGFRKSTGGNSAPFREQIDALIGVYDEKIDDGDIFDIVYVPGKGVDVYKNGAHQGTVESGLPFKRALFGIWISERPVQASLKRAMLGQ